MMNRRNWMMTLGGAAVAVGAEKRDMIVRSTRPTDLEMPLSGFSDWITPVEHFFVRSHHYTPKLDLASWKLSVGGEVAKPLTLSMDELKKLPSVELVAVLECAGNGRSLYEPSMPGLQWEHGGVGNARWRGVRLADVLKAAGVKPTAKHVLFDGADVPVGKQPEFQRTIPIAKALTSHTLLAYDMNGAPLEADHGFPLRVVVPGWAGDSWVKWVTKIEVLDKEFEGFFMKTGYRHPGRGTKPGVPVKPEDMRSVEEIQIKSVIASAGARTIGAAWSGESPVAAVDVSTDRGRTWQPAKITSPKTPFGMVTWEFAWTPPSHYHVVMARARDAKGRTQPLNGEWNPSGYQWNVVHAVEVDPAGAAAAAPPPTIAAPGHYRTSCLVCHEENVIAQQRLSRSQWDAEIGKMERWGAAVKPENRSELIDYLFARFGYKKR